MIANCESPKFQQILISHEIEKNVLTHFNILNHILYPYIFLMNLILFNFHNVHNSNPASGNVELCNMVVHFGLY